MIPVLSAGGSRIRIGPFEVDLKAGDIRVSEWPRFDRRFQWLEWKSEWFLSTPDGGIWMVSTPAGNPVLFRLSVSGDLICSTAMPRDPFVIHIQPQAFGEWFLVGNFLMRGHEIRMSLDDERRIAGLPGRFVPVRLGPDGMLLLQDELVLSPDGSIIPVFSIRDMWREIDSALRERGVEIRRPVPETVGWDEENVWIMVRDKQDRKQDVPVYPPFHPTAIAIAAFRRRPGGAALEWIDHVYGVIYSATHLMSDGGWAIDVAVHDANWKPLDRFWWLHVPGSRSVKVIRPSAPEWYETRQFSLLPGIGPVAIGEGLDGSGSSVLAWAGESGSGRIFRIAGNTLPKVLLSGPWRFIREGRRQTHLVFDMERKDISLPHGSWTAGDLLSGIIPGGRFRILRLVALDRVFMIIAEDLDAPDLLVVTGRFRKGRPEIVRRARVGAKIVGRIAAFRHGDGILVRFRTNRMSWMLFLYPDGAVAMHPYIVV